MIDQSTLDEIKAVADEQNAKYRSPSEATKDIRKALENLMENQMLQNAVLQILADALHSLRLAEIELRD